MPPNEPFTNFEDPMVRERLNEALARVNGQVEDIPIVIGGQEFRTNDVKYQVSVSINFILLKSILQLHHKVSEFVPIICKSQI